MEVSRHWRIKQQRYAMVGEVCPHCQGKIFPPRDICPECGEDARTLYHFSGRGEVYSYSTVFQAPEGHEEQTPYTVALVRLEEGPMVTAQITDIEDGSDAIKIGMPVEMVTRKLRSDGERGTIIYGYKFRPVMREFAAS
jgi:uncharacterized OB-fold protein